MRRHFVRTVAGLVAVVGLAGCGHPAPQALDDPGEPSASSAGNLDAVLQAAIDQVQHEHGIRGGIMVRDETSGKQTAIDADFPVRAASTSKVAVAMARFRLAATSGVELTEEDYQLIHDSLAYSDNAATQAIFEQLGVTPHDQYQALLEVYRLLGMDGIEESTGWGQTLVTARDEINLLEAIRTPPDWLGVHAAQVIHDDTRITAEDYDASQNFGVGSLIHHGALDIDDVFVKNGWLPERNGRWSVVSTGALTGPQCDLTVSITTFGAENAAEGMDASTTIAEPLAQYCQSR